VGRQTQAVYSVLRLMSEERRDQVRASSLDDLAKQLSQFGDAQLERIRMAAGQREKLLGIRSLVESTEVTPNPAATIVVRRKRFGTIPMDDFPPDKWEGYPSGAWDLIPITALYWCDGHRNLAEVIHLTQMELGPNDFNFVGYFRFLRAHGYVEFVTGQ